MSVEEGGGGCRHVGIALGGFMGTGKSTVGRVLAQRLGLPFVDLDEVLTRRHGPIPAQFARDGEATFRARERAAIADLCDGQARVVATGGGAWVDPDNREALRQHHLMIVLTAPIDVLRERIGTGNGRPLWNEALEQRYRERQPAYADADHVIDTATSSVEEVVEEIAKWS